MKRTLMTSAALVAAMLLAAPAGAQTGTGQFCLKTMAGQAKCAFQTMAQCEQARSQGSSDQCVDRSQVGGTTGSGTSVPQGGSSTTPPGGPSPMPPPR